MTQLLSITTRSNSLSSPSVWGIVGSGVGMSQIGTGIGVSLLNLSLLGHSDCIPSKQSGLPQAGGLEQALSQGNPFAKFNFLRFRTQSGEYRLRQAIPIRT